MESDIHSWLYTQNETKVRALYTAWTRPFFHRDFNGLPAWFKTSSFDRRKLFFAWAIQWEYSTPKKIISLDDISFSSDILMHLFGAPATQSTLEQVHRLVEWERQIHQNFGLNVILTLVFQCFI